MKFIQSKTWLTQVDVCTESDKNNTNVLHIPKQTIQARFLCCLFVFIEAFHLQQQKVILKELYISNK